jgi:hypothetical protein
MEYGGMGSHIVNKQVLVSFFRTLVPIYQSSCYCIPEDSIIYIYFYYLYFNLLIVSNSWQVMKS